MVHDVTSPVQEPAEAPGSADPVTRDKQALFGPLASGVRTHGGGISLGVVGLLIGAAAASPLIAIVGLVGGIAAGTAFLDKKNGQTNPIGQSTAKTLSPRRLSGDRPIAAEPESEISGSPAPPQISGRASNALPVAAGIAFDDSFHESEAGSPKPTANLHPKSRKAI